MQKTLEKRKTAQTLRERPGANSGAKGTQPSALCKVCVVGGGASGLVAVKKLKERGLSPRCFEMGKDLGGLWVANNSNNRPAAYRSLHINTSTVMMEFSDFPMPTSIGHFPHHRHIAKYFADYAAHFSLIDNIEFNTEVVSCEPLEKGYLVGTKKRTDGSLKKEHFDAVVVANGHHWSPAFPDPKPTSRFSGLLTHSSAYVDPSSPHNFSNQDVVIVGMGNSAMDIACELSRTGGARSVTVSARRGAWVLPKYLMGKPIDQGGIIPKWLPQGMRRRIVTRSFEWIYGKMSDFGLPEPDHLIGEAHPTVSGEFPQVVANGDIEVLGQITDSRADELTFSGGEKRRADAVIFCTGYDVRFPFFEPEHISAPDNVLPLYHRVFHPTHRHVFFVGLAQTIGAIMPVAEAQAGAIAAHLTGEFNLPSEEQMRQRIQEDSRRMKARFVASKRHTMQVDPETFHRQLRKDLQLGKKRAHRREGIAFPQRGTPPDERLL